MESNKTEQDLSRAEILLEEPHFDEATLLSARPVVPLEVVEAKSRSVRRLLIGSAIVVALLVGAFAATFVYRFRGEQQTNSVTATDDSASESQPAMEAGIAAIESQEPELTALDKKQPVEQTAVKNVRPTSPPLISQEPPRRMSRNGIQSRKQDEARDQTQEEEIAAQRELDKETRRAERREERRARRVEEAKHQGRDRDSRAPDDLLRIREIFEGRPRP